MSLKMGSQQLNCDEKNEFVNMRFPATMKYDLILDNILTYPVGNYMFKVKNRNTRTRYEICSKLTIKTPERRYWRRSGVYIVNFEHISHLVLVFLLLTLSR